MNEAPDVVQWPASAHRQFQWIGVVEVGCIVAGLYGPAWLRMAATFLLLGILLRSLVSVWMLGLVRPAAMRQAVRFRMPMFLIGAIALVGLIAILSRSN